MMKPELLTIKQQYQMKLYHVVCNITRCLDHPLSRLTEEKKLTVRAENEEKAAVTAIEALCGEGYCNIKIISCIEIPESGSEV